MGAITRNQRSLLVNYVASSVVLFSSLQTYFSTKMVRAFTSFLIKHKAQKLMAERTVYVMGSQISSSKIWLFKTFPTGDKK